MADHHLTGTDTGKIRYLARSIALLDGLTELSKKLPPSPTSADSGVGSLYRILKDADAEVKKNFDSSVRNLDRALTGGVSADNISRMVVGDHMTGVHSEGHLTLIDNLTRSMSALSQSIFGMSVLLKKHDYEKRFGDSSPKE
jgi:hypothetical protein